MTKAEMQFHDEQYGARVSDARKAAESGLYRAAVSAAFVACEHIDGMMRFQSRHDGDDFYTLSAIDIILKYAPLLLDRKSLIDLENFLKENKRIAKNISSDLANHLENARGKIWTNHCLWSHLQQNTGIRQGLLRRALGGDQDYWRSVIDSWSEMGLVRRKTCGGSYVVELSTRLGRVVRGKCPSCGRVSEAPKAMFLEENKCPECKSDVYFVLLAEEAGTVSE